MSKVRAEVRVTGLASRAEALWYDPTRWPTFIDGLRSVDKVEGDWPRPGARVVWTSVPGGRGRVVEVVEHQEARYGQQVAVEDEAMRGIQTITFRSDDGELVVALELEFQLKRRTPLTPVTALFVRRPQRESLQRTLRRFAVELRDDAI